MSAQSRDVTENWYLTDQLHEDPYAVKKHIERLYLRDQSLQTALWEQADIDQNYAAGNTSSWGRVYGFQNDPWRSQQFQQFQFNKIESIRQMIVGYQRQHRKSTVSSPVDNSDNATNDIYTKTLFHVDDRCAYQDVHSRAFEHGAITTGMSLEWFWLDKSVDPISGDIQCDHVPMHEFMIDPFFKKKDLSDCRYVWRRLWLSKPEAMRRYHNFQEEILEMEPRGYLDGKFPFAAQAYHDQLGDMFRVDEIYELSVREQLLLVDDDTGESTEFIGDEEELDIFLAENESVRKIKTKISTVIKTLLIDGQLFEVEPQPLGLDCYPCAPVYGYYDPEIAEYSLRTRGVVRNLRDPQWLYNRRKNIELDILESQINSGIVYKPDSLVDPNDVYKVGQGKAVAVKKHAEMSDFMKLPPAGIDRSLIELSEIVGREIMSISGVNEELLGAAEDDKAGILSMLRQAAGLTTLQTLFDNLEFSQLISGRIKLKLIQLHYSRGKIQRITQMNPTPQFYNKTFFKFDAKVEPGINTATQRQMAFTQALHLKELGAPISWAYLFEMGNFQNKNQMLQQIQMQEQVQQQAEQMQMQLQMQQLDAERQMMIGRAHADEGLGIERVSRVEENRAQALENVQDSRASRYKALLDIAKTMKELEGIPIANLQALANLAQQIDAMTQSNEEVTIEQEIEQPMTTARLLGVDRG